MSEMWNAL